jgi:hypothetical protein
VNISVGFNSHLAPFSGTGKMPVPQRVDFLVEWASCPFIKGLLTMVQHLNFNRLSLSAKEFIPWRALEA